jgi:mono/diheme cytochrome c family protein
MLTRLGALTLLTLAGWPSPGEAQRAAAPKLGPAEYEGWRQYSAHCARCHGQDVLGNPVAADLLKSTAAGGPVAEQGAFASVVKAGRPDHGMPGFGSTLTDEQTSEIYAYVKGRADGKIPAGRPVRDGT